MKKENSLDKLDSYFASQPKNVFAIALICVVGLIGYLVYDYGFENSEEYLNTEISARDAAQAELDKLNRFIQQQEERNTVQTLQANLEKAKEMEADVDADNEYFDKKLHEVSKLLYNQKNWSNFIEKINARAMAHNLQVKEVRTKRTDPKDQELQEAFIVEFELAGKYQSLLLFVNDIERSVDVVDVKNIKLVKPMPDPQKAAMAKQAPGVITPSSDIQAHVFISIWGLKY